MIVSSQLDRKAQRRDAPEIDEFRVSVVVEQDLGSEVLCRPAERVGQAIGGEVGLGESKVAEDDVARRVE